jgi:hypothetical protein
MVAHDVQLISWVAVGVGWTWQVLAHQRFGGEHWMELSGLWEWQRSAVASVASALGAAKKRPAARARTVITEGILIYEEAYHRQQAKGML